MAHEPFVYDVILNQLGQLIEFLEHPTRGDEGEVIVSCHELELAAYSGFFETDDMIASHKEYEPSFIDGKLYIGDSKAD